MKIYISGAITGTTDYMERFEKAEKELTAKGYSVVNPARVNAQLPNDTTYNDYLLVCNSLMNICDSIYMLEGWEKSKGARIEHKKAIDEEFDIYYQSDVAEWKSRMYNTFIGKQE